MGTMIHLSVGNLEIDWGKNESFADHSALYQTSDVAKVPSWYVKDYDLKDNNDSWELYADYQEGLTAPINKVADRLRLLGHTLEFCEKYYDYQTDEYTNEEFEGMNISFEELKHIFSTINVEILLDNKIKTHRHLDKEFNSQVVSKIMTLRNGLKPPLIEYFGGLSLEENLHPYVVINLLSLNPSALNLPIHWDFAGLVDSGWAKREDFVKPLDKSKRFLIVTEGSSDASIIKHAFHLLKPNISDFFDYVDMKEGYPFSGTGNLVNFVKGLISIGIYNNVVVLFDNDAEGLASFRRCKELNILMNMKILKLPNLPEFENFDTLGPDGFHKANINERGAAIECYLDFKSDSVVRWNNYNSYVQSYHGELEAKDRFKKEFLNQNSKNSNYDYSKIEIVLNMIIDSCVELKETLFDKNISQDIN